MDWFKIKNFVEYENDINKIKYKKYNQNYEDGIIKEIFDNIGTTNKISCEFGFHNNECNTLLLMENEWKCLFIDEDKEQVNKFNTMYQKKYIYSKAINHSISKENINTLLKTNDIIGDIDFLSIDIDSNDYYIMDIINVCNPRCICVEYNASLGPNLSCTVPYDATRPNIYLDYWGTSYMSLINLADKKGYNLVAVESGVNLFFVRKDVNMGELKIIKNAWQPPKSSTYDDINGVIPRHENRLKEQYEKIIDMDWNYV